VIIFSTSQELKISMIKISKMLLRSAKRPQTTIALTALLTASRAFMYSVDSDA